MLIYQIGFLAVISFCGFLFGLSSERSRTLFFAVAFILLDVAGALGMSFSPSLTLIFLEAAIVLFTVSGLLLFNAPVHRAFQLPGKGMRALGFLFEIPAVYIYSAGDDGLNIYLCTALLFSLVIAAVSSHIRSLRATGAAMEWLSWFAALFTLLCGLSSRALLILGAGMLCLTLTQCFERGQYKFCMTFLWCGLMFAVLFASVPSLFRGAAILYTNEALAYSGGEELLPGASWFDTDGNLIQAHGGQIQLMTVPDETGNMTERYIWVGENKSNGHTGNNIAVYSSDDLTRWTFEGNVFCSVESRQQLDEDPYFTAIYGDCTKEQLDEIYECINAGTVIERPKMLYNALTDQYVIWFHSDGATEDNSYLYDVGMAGVAVSDSPYGPFRFVGRYRLNQCPEDQIDCYPSSKGEARDMNLFQDEDGTAYIVYSSENNKTLYISRLNESYTYLSAQPDEAIYGVDYIRLFPGSMREAPVLIKNEGRYYLMSSSTTGWLSNQARVWSADTIFGEWSNDGNPCRGVGAGITFDTQSTSLFQTADGQWVYYGDRWNSSDLADSRYVWLPVSFQQGKLTISWESRWFCNGSL